MERLPELLSNPEVSCEVRDGHGEHDSLYFADVMPFFARKVVSRGVPFHILREKNVRELIKIYKGHVFYFIGCLIKCTTDGLTQERQDVVGNGVVGGLLIPVVVVISVGICTTAWCDVIGRRILVKIAIYWNLCVRQEALVLCPSDFQQRHLLI